MGNHSEVFLQPGGQPIYLGMCFFFGPFLIVLPHLLFSSLLHAPTGPQRSFVTHPDSQHWWGLHLLLEMFDNEIQRGQDTCALCGFYNSKANKSQSLTIAMSVC